MIRVLLADAHTILRQGLRLILNDVHDICVVGEAETGKEAIHQASALNPDIVLMDVCMPGCNGIEVTHYIRTHHPEIHVVFLTISNQDEDLIQAVKAGAKGYLLKTVNSCQLIDAIRRVAVGEAVMPPALMARVLDEFAAPQSPKLTDREIDTLNLIAEGMSNKEIAAALGISLNTVKTHVRHILEKLNLRNRAEAAAYVVRNGCSSGIYTQLADRIGMHHPKG